MFILDKATNLFIKYALWLIVQWTVAFTCPDINISKGKYRLTGKLRAVCYQECQKAPWHVFWFMLQL